MLMTNKQKTHTHNIRSMSNRNNTNNVQPKQRPQQSQMIKVSLGKPSLRLRLESYYTMIQQHDDLLSSKWEERFQQIWDKYGGTIQGEQLLANKLLKKYGIPFPIAATSDNNNNNTNNNRSSSSSNRDVESTSNTTQQQQQQQYTNEWYELNEKECNSGCIDCLSDTFDPITALSLNNIQMMINKNPFMNTINNGPILERVELFRTYLPKCDPLHIKKRTTNISNKSTTTTRITKHENTNDNILLLQRHVPKCCIETIQWYTTGPYSLLYHVLLHKERIRVMIRYVNSIRGTITGYITAFDQHMNLLMHDVVEQYCPRQRHLQQDQQQQMNTNDDDDEIQELSNAEAEVQRRMNCCTINLSKEKDDSNNKSKRQLHKNNNNIDEKSYATDPTIHAATSSVQWTHRQRYMRQIMVRGDNIVLIYKVSDERSVIPIPNTTTTTTTTATTATTAKTGKTINPPKPRYNNINDAQQQHPVHPHQQQPRFGTPGSFVFNNNSSSSIDRNTQRRRHNNYNNTKQVSNHDKKYDYNSNF